MLSSFTRTARTRLVALFLVLVTSLLLLAGCEGDDDGGFQLAIDASVLDVSLDQIGPLDAARDTNIVLPADAGKDGDAEGGTQVFGVGGSVTGLGGSQGLVLQLNGANNLPIINDGVFVFPTLLTTGATYSVTIGTQPAGKTCSVSAGSGTVQNAHVTGVVVNCAANTFTVGGSITGLAAGASVTLQNNGGNALTRNANGAFAFTTPIATGAAYAVTVSTQPGSPAQVCTVANGTGTMGNSNVTNIAVTCVTSTFTVGGSVTGLAAGASLVLQNSGGDNLTVNQNGTFTFATAVASGAAYTVSVLTNPTNPAQTCTVTNGAGNIAAASITNVAVACTTTSFTVGGSIAGLNPGGTIVLQNNGGDDLTRTTNGAFTFATSVPSGSAYNVTIVTQPANQICTVSAPSGNVGAGNVTTVNVNCGNTYTVGGTVTGLGAGSVVLNVNGAANTVTVAANGTFAFPLPLLDGDVYAVTVATQPSNPTQTCVVTNAGGTIAGANITNVGVTCTTNTYQLGGVVSGLAAGETVQLQNNGGDTITVAANGNFVFPASVPSGTAYTVTVSQDPITPIKQTCLVTSGTGTIGAGNALGVQVNCTTDSFVVGGNLTGLALGATVVLQNNGADNLALTNNGAFQFATPVISGGTYNATVLNNPANPSQSCVATLNQGTVGAANVTSIAVSCTTNSFTVGGTVVGFDNSNESSLVLQNNGGDDLTLNGNGAFTFQTPVLSGATYAVTVSQNPQSPAQTCIVSAAAGTMGGGNINTVTVNCSTNTYTVGGTVSNLAPGNTVVLRNNGGDDLPVTANGAFAFSQPIASGAGYSVNVFTSPTAPVSQSCVVVQATGSGTVGNANVTSVQISCATNAFTVGGNISGLAPGNAITLRNNGGDDLGTQANGSFIFPTAISSGNGFNVTVVANPQTPIQQTCVPTSGAGTIGNANVSNVQITCTTTQYQVSGTVFGLAQGPLVLQNNGANDVTLNAAGGFTFTALVDNGSPYNVTIGSQPNIESQNCIVSNPSGTMPAANVSNVIVYCGWTCGSIRSANPNALSGSYVIDPDGAGGAAQLTAVCDMSFDGGGWTLIQNILSGLGPVNGTQGTVTTAASSYVPIGTARAIANLSSQVHIRTPGSFSPTPTIFVTSTANSVPIQNLRQGKLLNFGIPFGLGSGYAGRAYWNLSSVFPTNNTSMLDTNCSDPQLEDWPNVYWACGNLETGWWTVGPVARWRIQGDPSAQQVWVR